MDNSKDPLRNGAIFKLKAGALRSPPKIVQFEAPKGSASKTPLKPISSTNVNSEVRNAFDHIYRQTPTPKILLGRSAQERTSSVNSPYWTSNLAHQLPTPPPITPIQTPIIAPACPIIQNITPTAVADVFKAPENVAPAEPVVPILKSTKEQEDTSINEVVLESDAEPDPVIKPVKRSAADAPTHKSPNLLKKARLEEPSISSVEVASVAATRSTRTSTSLSRADICAKIRSGIRSRTNGADSLLLLVSGAASSAPSQRSSSVGPSRGVSRTLVSVPTVVTSALVNSVPARAPAKPREKPITITSTSTSATEQAAMATLPAARVRNAAQENTSAAASTDVVAKSRSRPTGKGAVPISVSATAAAASVESDSEPLAAVNPKHTAAASRRAATSSRAVKRKLVSGGDSEQSEPDISPPVKSRTAPKRVQRGQRNPTERQSSDDEDVVRAKQEGNGGAEEEEEEEDGEVTVTRSGRKSIPKKVIPLAEDATQSEKQQLRANRARRASSAPAPARRSSGASRTRKPVGSAAVAAEREGKATKAAKSAEWSASESLALYRVQGRTDISAPNFWELVSEGLAEVDIERSAVECQQKWFEKVAVAVEKKKNKEEKSNAATAAASSATAPAVKSTSSSKYDEEEPPAKAKRLGKGALKRMAQESSRATRDDDIFDSEAMRSYWAEDAPERALDDELLEDLQQFDPADHAAAASSKTSTGGAGGASAHANKRNGAPGEESDEDAGFGGSHVHKLNYRPPSRLFAAAQAPKAERSTKSAPNKTGKMNSTLISKQVNAAVQGARNTVRGVRGDSSDEDSSELDSEEDEEDM